MKLTPASYEITVNNEQVERYLVNLDLATDDNDDFLHFDIKEVFDIYGRKVKLTDDIRTAICLKVEETQWEV